MKQKELKLIHKTLRDNGYIKNNLWAEKPYDSWLWHDKAGITIEVIKARSSSISRCEELTNSVVKILKDAGFENVETGQQHVYVRFAP